MGYLLFWHVHFHKAYVYSCYRIGHTRVPQVFNIIRQLPNMYLLPQSIILETCSITTPVNTLEEIKSNPMQF